MASVAETVAYFDDYYAALVSLTTAQQAVTDLGPRPSFGTILTADGEYDIVIAAQASWDASNPGLVNNVSAAADTANQIEQNTISVCYPDQWVHLTGLVNYPGGIAYVGYANVANTKLLFQTAVPIYRFPNTATS